MKFMLQLHKQPKCLERKRGARMGALENRAEQTWTSHHVIPWNEMKSVAGDALGNQKRNLFDEATAEDQRHQWQIREHLQGYQQGVRRNLSEVRPEVQVQQDASGEEVENLRR